MSDEMRPSKIEITQGSREGGVVRESMAFLRRPFYAWYWRLRTRWLLRRGVIHAHRWRNPPLNKILVVVMWMLSLLLVVWVVRALVTLMWYREGGWSWGPYNPDAGCTSVVTSCDAVNGIVMPVLLLAYSTVAFLAWRLLRVRRYYTRQAREHPEQLVQSAGSLIEQVVGRDQVCDAIMNNLHDRRVRRPHVIIGNVGSGKTALMVHLTERLAARGAIPVPIRLRDVQHEEDLDFCELARRRFGEIVAPVVTSGAELDRVWRWLRRSSDRIVVVADGLDEALAGGELAGRRDNTIRKAIAQVGAGKVPVPLVIASRPHDPLRAMQAAISDLEPLSDEAALHYVASAGTWRADLKPIDRLVEAANMAESPLYLQIAKDLHARDLLEPVWSDDGSGQLETQDRWALRESLLYSWFDALTDGAIHPELPIDSDTRNAVVEFVSALACIGLASDSSRVSLATLDPNLSSTSRHADGHECGMTDKWVERTAHRLGERMARLQRPDGYACTSPAAASTRARTPWMDVRVAATWGARMGLVHESGDEVHFQHSIIQAYLGSRFLDAQLRDATPVDGPARPVDVTDGARERVTAAAERAGGSPAAAPESAPHPARGATATAPRPVTASATAPPPSSDHIAHAIRHGGRELLIALTLYSRSLRCTCTCRDGESGSTQPCAVALTVEQLRACAGEVLDQADQAERRVYRTLGRPSDGEPPDNRAGLRRRALDLYGAAMDVTTVDDHPRIDEVLAELEDQWALFGIGEDPARLSDAKRNVVKQCGAAIRHVPQQEKQKRAYARLYQIGIAEPDARVRAAITQEIGTGAEVAFEALADRFRSDPRAGTGSDGTGPDEAGPDGSAPAGPPAAARFVDADGVVGMNGHGADLSARDQRAWRLHDLRLRQRRERKVAEDETAEERRVWQKKVLDAWTLPLLVESASRAYHAGSPQGELERLIAEIAQRCRRESVWFLSGATTGSAPPEADRNGSVHGARNGSDGFARSGPEGIATFDPGSGEALSAALARGLKYAANRRPGAQSHKEGREFLKKQTGELLKRSTFWLTRLTLVQALALWALPDDVNAPQPMRGQGADPGGQVREWLARPDGAPEHPLVEAAGRLAVRALQTRRPERFLWIDEATVASAIGTEVSSPGEQRYHNLWIPPSTGWSSLDPLAQQLLADELVHIVLAERGYRPKELFSVVDRLRDERRLPACLSKDRSRLDPVRAVESDAQPGDHCPCGMRMCPYPAKAERDLRVEFTEVFCLHQRDMLKAWQPRSWLYLRLRREARWQRSVPVAGMRRFWDEMGERARDVNPQESRTARRQIRS